MQHTMKYIICLALAGGGVLPAAAAQTSTGQMLSKSAAAGVREHVDEAEDLTESLLRWKHIVIGVAGDDVRLRMAPANTSISVDRADAQRLNALLSAITTQVPARADGSTIIRGDLRSHVEKAQAIARELLPANSSGSEGKSAATGGAELITIDRTSLERLDVELDAIATIVPRMTKTK